MAAWTYADWPSQSTPAARLERARLHLSEVNAAVNTLDVQGDGYGVSAASMVQYQQNLMADIARMESLPAYGGRNGGFSVMRRGRVR
jgi:hypothetical protein